MEKIEVNGVNYSRVSCEKLNEIITEKDESNPFKDETYDYLGKEHYNSDYLKTIKGEHIHECTIEVKDGYGLPDVVSFYEGFKCDKEDMITEHNFYI